MFFWQRARRATRLVPSVWDSPPLEQSKIEQAWDIPKNPFMWNPRTTFLIDRTESRPKLSIEQGMLFAQDNIQTSLCLTDGVLTTSTKAEMFEKAAVAHGMDGVGTGLCFLVWTHKRDVLTSSGSVFSNACTLLVKGVLTCSGSQRSLETQHFHSGPWKCLMHC